MDFDNFIRVKDFCASYEISHAVVVEMNEYGIISITSHENEWFIPLEELPKAEKMVRIHSDLGVNIEGVQVVSQLLNRVEEMTNTILRLENRLGLFE